MNSVPSTAPEQDLDTDENESSWTDFVLPLGCFALAAIPFTPLWDQLTDPDGVRRKYAGAARFLDTVGPVPVTLVFAGLGLALLVGAIARRSRRNGFTTEG